METSQLLARIIGPYMLVAGLSLFVNRDGIKSVLDEFPHSTLITFVIGAVALIVGLLMVQFHNVWTLDWRVLITLIGWISLIKGATAMLAPRILLGIADTYRNNDTLMNIQAVIAILFGLFITYMGFIA